MVPRLLSPAILALAAAAAAAPAPAPAPAPVAEDGGDPDLAEARKVAATRIAALGNWCRGRSLRRSARECWEEAIRLDPDEAAARAGLGHERGGEGWRKPAKPDESPDARLSGALAVAAYASEVESAHREAADGFAALAARLQQEGKGPEAAAAWRTVLRYDPSRAGAREALGLAAADAGWLRTGVPGPAATKARFASLAAKGSARLPPATDAEAWKERSATEAPFGESREVRFRVKSYHEKAVSRDLLEGMLRAEALYEALEAIPPRTGKDPPLTYVLMTSRKAFQDAVNGRKDRDEAWKKARVGLSGMWWSDTTYMKWTSSAASALDSSIHVAVHHLFDPAAGGKGPAPWLDEALAHVASTTLRGTGRIWCVALRGSAFEKDLAELKDWDEEAREDLRAGRDPPLREIAAGGLNDLSAEALVKGRSVVAWLLATSPRGLLRLVEGRTRDLPPEDMFLDALGAPPEAVERRWRCWALLP